MTKVANLALIPFIFPKKYANIQPESPKQSKKNRSYDTTEVRSTGGILHEREEENSFGGG